MENVLVGTNLSDCKKAHISAPDDDSIDYHFEIDENFEVGKTCLMCFRTQIFTTRSHVAIVSGIESGNPRLLGLYDSLGSRIEKNW